MPVSSLMLTPWTPVGCETVCPANFSIRVIEYIIPFSYPVSYEIAKQLLS